MSKTNVFVIMPFKDEFFEVYEMLKENFADDFVFAHAGDDVATQQNILKDIIEMIYNADVIIADLTELNPNVFYELGIAHTLHKKVIAISQDISTLPFDIRSYRTIEYSTHFKKFAHLVKELSRFLIGSTDNSFVFGNPVTDFLGGVDNNTLKEMFSNSRKDVDLSGEEGYIDNLADIEDEMTNIANSLELLTGDMETMSKGIDSITNEIDRVAKAGGSSSASFMRKKAHKAADFIHKYSISQKNHNEIFAVSWPSVERNCLALMESGHVATDENKDSLISFLHSLFAMKEASLITSGQTKSFLDSFLQLRGFQRSLNQAINLLEQDVKIFLDFIEQMCASIARILDKSRFVVGDIDYSTIETPEIFVESE
jgi:hypothetical protein